MLIFDQLKRSDPAIRTLAYIFLIGTLMLLAGLWYIQIFSSKQYIEKFQNQALRTIRVPAVRGKILDKNNVVLAECRPSYNISMFLEEMSGEFKNSFQRLLKQTPQKLNRQQREELAKLSRFLTISNAIAKLSQQLNIAVNLDPKLFEKHYEQYRAFPMSILEDITPAQIALFLENPNHPGGFDMDFWPLRYYPYQTVAAHLIGGMRRLHQDEMAENEDEPFFHYALPDFKGAFGVEAALDNYLRGKAGFKTALVNNLGYRESEKTWIQTEPGNNVILTIDINIQKEAERALSAVGPNVKGAVVVMDPNTGDIIALVSAPAFNPNSMIPRIPAEEWKKLNDPELMPMLNRATFGAYTPGSIFKIIVALACLEAGIIDPEETISNPGYFQLGRRTIRDTAPPGDYNFKRAFKLSSNTYFIHFGLKAGLSRILDMGHRFCLGQKFNIPVYQETSGFFPPKDYEKIRKTRGEPWLDGDTANLCIGQGEITVTPIQMAIMTSAIANGGKILWPRLVDKIIPADPLNKKEIRTFPHSMVRNTLNVSSKHLELIKESMLADVEDPDGTGRQAAIPNFRVCGKTGTAQIMKGRSLIRKDTWFVSFAPYENPRYVVVVMVEGGGSGGGTCAPVAKRIYQALARYEKTSENKLMVER